MVINDGLFTAPMALDFKIFYFKSIKKIKNYFKTMEMIYQEIVGTKLLFRISINTPISIIDILELGIGPS